MRHWSNEAGNTHGLGKQTSWQAPWPYRAALLALLLLLVSAAVASTAAAALQPRSAMPALLDTLRLQPGLSQMAGELRGHAWSAPLLAAQQPAGRYLKRLQTRAERSLGRFGTSLAAAALLWLWLMGTTAVFLVSAAVASVIDVRMLDLRPERLRHLRRDLFVGVRLFFRVLRDRGTPVAARIPLLLALGYWLVPFDLIADTPVFPGFLDDLLIAIAGAKAFLYLCPDSVVVRNAQAIAAAGAEASE